MIKTTEDALERLRDYLYVGDSPDTIASLTAAMTALSLHPQREEILRNAQRHALLHVFSQTDDVKDLTSRGTHSFSEPPLVSTSDSM